MPLLTWFGSQAKDYVGRKIDARMVAAGRAAVAESERVVHVVTGELKRSIGYTYRQSDRTLQLHADAPYAVWEEKGTRFRAPHPFLGPGLLVAGRVLGMRTEMQFTNVIATKTVPQPHHMARLAANEALNRAMDKRLGRKHTAVFHGDHPGSLLGFHVSYRHKVKYGKR